MVIQLNYIYMKLLNVIILISASLAKINMH